MPALSREVSALAPEGPQRILVAPAQVRPQTFLRSSGALSAPIERRTSSSVPVLQTNSRRILSSSAIVCARRVASKARSRTRASRSRMSLSGSSPVVNVSHLGVHVSPCCLGSTARNPITRLIKIKKWSWGRDQPSAHVEQRLVRLAEHVGHDLAQLAAESVQLGTGAGRQRRDRHAPARRFGVPGPG